MRGTSFGRSFLFVALAGTLISLQAPRGDAATQAPRPRPAPGGRAVDHGEPASPFASTGNELYDKLMAMLTRAPGTMDGFLAQLKQSPDFFQSIKTKSVFYESQSRHESSPDFPRALIMYGNADLVVTFNGSPQQKLYGAMEIMGYNRKAGQFEFREITFKNDASPEQLASVNADSRDDFEFDNANVKIRKANSDKCTACHDDSAQPIWGTYLAWRGSFGSYEESFNLAKPRYAHSDLALENTKLDAFKAKSQQLSRYRNFYWGQAGHPFEYEISSTFFGIALNYRMAYNALNEALHHLAKPENQKYRYAFAGDLLNCDQNFLASDSHASSIAADMLNKTTDSEITNRKGIESDHRKYGDTLHWDQRYPISVAARVNATTARPASGKQFAKLENLYRTMHLSSSHLYLPGSMGSWDGYNQVQDFMTDYFAQFYGMPLVSAINKRAAEVAGGFASGQSRTDLEMPLQITDFEQMKPMLDALALPAMPAGGLGQLCQQLAAESQRAGVN